MADRMKWPFHDDDEIAAVTEVLKSGRTNYWTGEHGHAFEDEFADYCDTQFALAVSNGTTALELALRGCGITEGEVIVPARTFIATAAAVNTVGATPVLADISPVSMNVTVDTIDARCTTKTVAVIVVHYAGWPCEMDQIKDYCEKHDLILIEDCAHAQGALINARPMGSWGHVGCYSFCQGKIMSTGGEGGMVVTNNADINARMVKFRDHGRYQMVAPKENSLFQWTVDEFGSNLRMTEMQAAIGRIQLKKLDWWVHRRNHIAQIYDQALLSAPHTTILTPDPREIRHARYMYLFQVRNRNRILERLNEYGIAARLGGCPNIGYEKAFGHHGHGCTVADVSGAHVMALPIYPTLSDDEVNKIKTTTRNVIEEINRL